MKKENIFRKTIINSLIGFPIGITLLMINYICIYFISGENVFKNEILQLQDISTLILQLIIIGLAYYISFIFCNVIAYLSETRATSDKFVTEHPYKTIVIMLIFGISVTIILALLNFEIFSQNIAMMNIISFVIIFVLFGVFVFIKSAIESNLIRQINQKLKERNI